MIKKQNANILALSVGFTKGSASDKCLLIAGGSLQDDKMYQIKSFDPQKN